MTLQRLRLVTMTLDAVTLRYSNIGVTFPPSATPANAEFDARVRQTPTPTRFAFARGTTRGDSEISYGDLRLMNDDGALDALADYEFDGRPILVEEAWIPASGALPAYPADFETVFDGLMLFGYTAGQDFVVTTRGKERELLAPIQTARFAGDNVLPDGLEGTADDLIGTEKPLPFGRIRNFRPPCVNPSKLIYQISGGAVDLVDDVFDSGISLSTGFPVGGMTITPAILGGVTITGFAFGAGLYVAVGFDGRVYTSPDAVTWTSRTSTFGALADIQAVLFAGGLFVAVGDAGKIASSANGTAWTARASAAMGTDRVTAIAYGKGVYVITSETGKIETSPDGTAWTSRTSPFGGTAIRGVTFGRGLFVAVGDGGKIATSPDGTTWTLRAGSWSTYAMFCASFGKNLFLVGGDNGTIATSPDGVTWTTRTNLTGTTSRIYAASYGAGVWVAVGSEFVSSTDLVLWNNRMTNLSGLTFAVLNNAGFVLAGGFSGDLATTIPPGVTYANLTDLVDDTLAPAQGTWKWVSNPAGSYIRLGASPAGLITTDFAEGATAADRTAGQIFKRMMERAGKVEDVDFSGDDIDDLDVANGDENGIIITDNTTYGAALTRVAGSVGAWWGPDRSGLYRVKRLELPSGPNAATFLPGDIKGRLQRAPRTDMPAYAVAVECRRNWTVQTSGIAGNVSDEARAALAKEFLQGYAIDSGILTAHPLAQQLLIEQTLLADVTAGDAEAARLLILYGEQRDWYTLTVPEDEVSVVLDRGDVILLQNPRYGLGTGKQFVILGIEPDAASRQHIFHVWGGP